MFENVAFTLRVTGASSREIRRRVPLALGLVGLKRRLSKTERALRGRATEVCVARAIVNRPAVLLADEPTGNLDP